MFVEVPNELVPEVRKLIACVVGGLVLLILAISAEPAQAALYLEFDVPRGRPGTSVGVKTEGRGACTACPQRMKLYFVKAGIAGEIESRTDSRLTEVGFLVVDRSGDGRGQFIVPSVTSGPYVVMTYCGPCAATSAGRSMLPLGPDPPFEVIGRRSSGSSWPWWASTFLAAGALIVGFGLLVRRRFARLKSL